MERGHTDAQRATHRNEMPSRKKPSARHSPIRGPGGLEETPATGEEGQVHPPLPVVSERETTESVLERTTAQPAFEVKETISSGDKAVPESVAADSEAPFVEVETMGQKAPAVDKPAVAEQMRELDTAESRVNDGLSDESAIPPIKQIQGLLTDFEMRVPVWGLTVFTVDGYVLAHRVFYEAMPEDVEMAVSSMSAGLIAISQAFSRLVAEDSLFRQVLIDADNYIERTGFSILLKQVADNVMLTCIFPNSSKLGLVTFEIENLSTDINEAVGLWDVKLHTQTMT